MRLKLSYGWGTPHTYDSGDKYEGNIKDGLPHGQGTLTYAHGDKYVGEYKDDNKHGQGTLTTPDGTKLKVEMNNGKLVE